MTDIQKDAMYEALELIEESNLTPKSTWAKRDRKRKLIDFNPKKLARRIQMNKNWKRSSNKHVATDCGIHMPPKEAKYKHSGKSMGVATTNYYYGSSSDHSAYWWNDEDKKPERIVDVIHAHAHVQGNDKTHGPGFAQAVYEIVDSQFETTKSVSPKKFVQEIYTDLDITRGRGRKITGKPRSKVEDYIKAAPTSADALRKLIEGLS